MLSYALDSIETRVLGCLLEKERVTPENYPLSLHSLAAACNQATNREPVTSFDEKEVEAALQSLREKKLASVIFGAGSRVQKYRHRLLEHFELQSADVAILCVLLLRGPQTPGELRNRAERMHPFGTLAEVQSVIAALGVGTSPLVRVLPARPGQKEDRVMQLFSSEESAALAKEEDAVSFRPRAAGLGIAGRSPLEECRAEIATLRSELQQLRDEFLGFRKQFE